MLTAVRFQLMRRLHYFPGFAVPVLGRRAGSLGNFCMGLWLCFPDEKKIGAENKHVTFSGMVGCFYHSVSVIRQLSGELKLKLQSS